MNTPNGKGPYVGPDRDERYRRAILPTVATALDQAFNGGAPQGERTTGWVLLAFPIGGRVGQCLYTSNCATADVAQLLHAQAARMDTEAKEANNPTPGENEPPGGVS